MRALSATDPTAIGPYRLLGVLGGGGMGRVYLGQSPAGRQLAIKVLRGELTEDQAYLRRFAREVEIARSISPLYTAPLVDADPTADPPWLATVFIDGPSLHRWVDLNGPMAPATVLTLAAGLAEALVSIHRVGLVHRDLKPSNVLLNDAGPHIIDFGVALVPDASRVTDSVMVGTPSYMAPERIQGSEADAAADIFSLGATLVYAATGKSLVSQGTVYEQIVQISTGRFDLSAIPAALRPLIVRCLSHRAKDRPTAEEIARILVGSGITPPAPGWLSSTSTEVPQAVTDHFDTPVAPARLSRRRVLAIAGGAGVVVAGGGIGLAAALIPRTSARTVAQPSPTLTGSSTIGPTAPSLPPRFAWVASSKLTGRGTDPYAERILIDRAGRLITATGPTVSAVDHTGERAWQLVLGTGGLRLRRWGDLVLVNDDQRVWLVSAADGTVLHSGSPVADETVRAAGNNPDHTPIQINRTLVGTDHAFLDLGTALIAIAQTCQLAWRVPRPLPAPGSPAPTVGTPQAANGTSMLARVSTASGERLTLYADRNGYQQWSVPDPLVTSAPTAGGGGPISGPPPTGSPGGPGGANGGPGGIAGGPPGSDPAWSLSEGRFGGSYIILRDGRQLQARRVRDGQLVWQQLWPNEVVGIEVVGDVVVVSADQVYGLHVQDGASKWNADVRPGARIGITLDGTGVVAASLEQVSMIDLNGSVRWQVPMVPQVGQGATADRLTVGATTGYLTFQPGGNLTAPLPVDVVAFSLAD